MLQECDKIVVLAYIGETIVNVINKEDVKYIKVKEAMDFCWRWIEYQSAEIVKIYDFLDDEDEDDLVSYMINAGEEKNEYSIILGVVSYIAYNILIHNREPIPQFLSGIDEEYFNLIIEDAIRLKVIDRERKKINKIVEYCSKKDEKEFSLIKSQITSL